MSKFLFGVSDLVKTECRNVMLLEYMNISRLMTHAQQVEGDKLREMAKDNKKSKIGIMNTLSRNRWKSLTVSTEVYNPSTFIS